MAIKGYKAFSKGLIDHYGREFTEGESYEIDAEPSFSGRIGYSFCKRPEDGLRAFDYTDKVEIAEVTAYGDLEESESDYFGFYNLYLTNKIRIDRILTRNEILAMYLSMKPNDRVKRFIELFTLSDDELDTLKKVMVDDQPKDIVSLVNHLDGSTEVKRDYNHTIKGIKKAIKESKKRNKELRSIERQKTKVKQKI